MYMYNYVYSGDMQLTVWRFFNVSFMYIYIIKDMAITTESCDVAPFLQFCRECDNYDFSLHIGILILILVIDFMKFYMC